MGAYFLIFIYLYSYRNKINFKGELFFEYLFLTGFVRFLIEFIREHPISDSGFAFMYLGLSGAQYISLLMILVGFFMHYKSRLISN
jgi:prolipoprotein diacylglyceryltransferase